MLKIFTIPQVIIILTIFIIVVCGALGAMNNGWRGAIMGSILAGCALGTVALMASGGRGGRG